MTMKTWKESCSPLIFKIQSKRRWKDIKKMSTFDDFSLCWKMMSFWLNFQDERASNVVFLKKNIYSWHVLCKCHDNLFLVFAPSSDVKYTSDAVLTGRKQPLLVMICTYFPLIRAFLLLFLLLQTLVPRTWTEMRKTRVFTPSHLFITHLLLFLILQKSVLRTWTPMREVMRWLANQFF